MRRSAWIALVALLAFGPSLLAADLPHCLTACPARDNVCLRCCVNQWKAAKAACIKSCTDADSRCYTAEAMKCNDITDPDKEAKCYTGVSKTCATTTETCRDLCETTEPTITGKCATTKKVK